MQIQHSSQFMKARQPRQVGLVVYLMQNLHLRGRSPAIIFAQLVKPTTLSLTVFTQVLRLRRYEWK